MMQAAPVQSGGGLLDLGTMGGAQIALADQSELDSERYEQLWTQLPVAFNGHPLTKQLNPALQPSAQQMEQHLKASNVHCIASGQQGSELKFFFHCQLADKSGFFLMECLVNLQVKQMSMTVKATRPELEPAFAQFLDGALKSMC